MFNLRKLFIPALLLVSACSGGSDAPSKVSQTAEWERQSAGTSARLQAVSAVSDLVVWVSGDNGTYARTLDGGANWSAAQVPGAESLEFRDVHAFDQDRAFLMSAGEGSTSRVFRTQDGGANWETVYTNNVEAGFFSCMTFWDRDRGVVFSDAPDTDFMLLVTEDGGDTFNRVPPDSLEDAHPGEGAFAASGTCMVAGPDGRAWFGTGASGVDTRVYRTADFGKTWAASPTPVPSSSGSSGIFTLAFLDTQRGFALGGEYTRPDSLYGHAATTEDGGVNWTSSPGTGLGGAVFGSTFVPGAPKPTAVAVAPTGSAWTRDGGLSWSRINAESYWAVGASPEGAVWAVGPGGHIARLIIDRQPETESSE